MCLGCFGCSEDNGSKCSKRHKNIRRVSTHYCWQILRIWLFHPQDVQTIWSEKRGRISTISLEYCQRRLSIRRTSRVNQVPSESSEYPPDITRVSTEYLEIRQSILRASRMSIEYWQCRLSTRQISHVYLQSTWCVGRSAQV